MGMEDLNDIDLRVYEYVKSGDFETKKWNTKDAAESLGIKEDDVYQSLSNLAKHIKDKIWIYYKGGGLRIVAE